MNITAVRQEFVSLLRERQSLQSICGGRPKFTPADAIEAAVSKALEEFSQALKDVGVNPTGIHIASRLFTHKMVAFNLAAVIYSEGDAKALMDLTTEISNRILKPKPKSHLRIVK